MGPLNQLEELYICQETFLLQNMLVGLIPLFFMSFDDSETGLIRAVTQKRHIKSWEGSLAIFTVCITVGYALLGTYGILIEIVATLVEKYME